MIMNIRRALHGASVLLLIMVAFPAVATAQGYYMNVSVYEDSAPYMDEDGLGTLFAYVSTADDSFGCTHWNHQTTGYINSPSRSSFDFQFGFGTSPSLAYEFEEGNWQIGGYLEFQCDCMSGDWVGGGGTVTEAQTTTTPYLHHYYRVNNTSPYEYVLNEDSQDRRCSHSSMRWNQYHASGITDAGTYHTLFGLPFACYAKCILGQFGTASGPFGQTIPRQAQCG